MKPDMDLIGALTSFSVGTLDGRDAMMVIELATTPEEYERGIRHQMPVAMTPEHARELGEAIPKRIDGELVEVEPELRVASADVPLQMRPIPQEWGV